jgi:hypothetical protein
MRSKRTPFSHLVPTVSDRGAPSPEMAKVSSAGATLAVSKMGVGSAVAHTMKDDGARNGLVVERRHQHGDQQWEL